jgi:hypothetical protein
MLSAHRATSIAVAIGLAIVMAATSPSDADEACTQVLDAATKRFLTAGPFERTETAARYSHDTLLIPVPKIETWSERARFVGPDRYGATYARDDATLGDEIRIGATIYLRQYLSAWEGPARGHKPFALADWVQDQIDARDFNIRHSGLLISDFSCTTADLNGKRETIATINHRTLDKQTTVFIAQATGLILREIVTSKFSFVTPKKDRTDKVRTEFSLSRTLISYRYDPDLTVDAPK